MQHALPGTAIDSCCSTYSRLQCHATMYALAFRSSRREWLATLGSGLIRFWRRKP